MRREQPGQDGSRVVDAKAPEPAVVRLATASPASPRLGETPTLAGYAWILADRRWTVTAIFGATLAAAAIYLFIATPIYRSNAVFQVEDRTKTVAGLEELSSAFTERTPADTEIEIIRSRMLVSAVVDQLDLDIQAVPRRVPLLGRLLARRHRGGELAPPVPGLSRFAWGGERVLVTRLEVSDDLLGRPLRMTALDGGRYQVEDGDVVLLPVGKVGEAAATPPGNQRRVELFVSELVARPGTQFHLAKLRRDDVVANLQDELRIGEKVKKTGILTVSLDGPDPVLVARIIEAVSNTYVRQNVERKSAEAAKTLEFLESQLPTLKKTADAAQAALNDLRMRKGSVDITMESQSVVNRTVEVEKALSELELQRSELRQRFTENHPALTSLNDKEQKLRAERAAMAARMRGIPLAEMDSARLTRDVRASSELYSLLLNKAQELRIQRSGTIGNVRILDRAVTPHKPVSPNTGAVLVLSAMLGLVAGVTGAFARNAFDQGVEDPEEIEAGTGLVVYATVPHSDRQGVTLPGQRGRPPSLPVLAAVDPGDVAVESLRSLRTSLKFAFVESHNNIVAIGGPGPQVGKSFVAVNLAWVLATAESRVLLVDCDLRRGRLHRYFGVERHPGVSDVIGGTIQAPAAVRTTGNPNLDLLTTGHIPPNPAELLSSQRFEDLLSWASSRYGYVVVDTPPILAVADPAIVARLAGVNLLVLRGGLHSLREIALAVKRFAQSGVRVQGAVLNDVSSSGGRYGRDGRYRKYEYRSEHSG
jgi:tyrosine-protein kinase Etk/Wzc